MKITQNEINKLRENFKKKRQDYTIKVVHRCMNCIIKKIKLSAQNGDDNCVFTDSDFFKCYNKGKAKYFNINTSQFTYFVADNLINMGFTIQETVFGCIKVDLTKEVLK